MLAERIREPFFPAELRQPMPCGTSTTSWNWVDGDSRPFLPALSTLDTDLTGAANWQSVPPDDIDNVADYYCSNTYLCAGTGRETTS